MTKEELNIWIAEKLMGLEYKATTDIFPFPTWWDGENMECTKFNLPNYFTEGWEQVKTWLTDHNIRVTEVSVPALHNMPPYYSITLTDMIYVDGESPVQINLVTRHCTETEMVRWEVINEIQPEIERRLA